MLIDLEIQACSMVGLMLFDFSNDGVLRKSQALEALRSKQAKVRRCNFHLRAWARCALLTLRDYDGICYHGPLSCALSITKVIFPAPQIRRIFNSHPTRAQILNAQERN